MNLWRQPAAGGAATQMTSLDDDGVRCFAWTPRGFVLGVGPSEDRLRLCHLPATGGGPRDLPGSGDLPARLGAVHPDGERIVVADGAGLHLLRIAGGHRQTLLEGPCTPGPWHPDGRRLAVALGGRDAGLVLLDVATGRRARHPAWDASGLCLPTGFGAGGRDLYVLTDRDHEFRWLARLPLDGGAPEPVWRGPWDVEHAATDRDGRRLAWVVNEGGISRFHARDLERGRDLPVPAMPGGWCRHFALSPDGKLAAALVGSATRPMEVYAAELGAAGAATRLTSSFQGGVPEAGLVAPEAVTYPTFDGRRVPAWLYRPREARGRGPVVLSIHAGPRAQERPGTPTTPLYQHLLSRGVGVLAPNIRGSTGYGRAYEALIVRDWGGGELRDVEAAAGHLRTLDWVDPARVALYGASFGGFETLAAMTRLPDLWACGVALYGPSDLVRWLREGAPPWSRALRGLVGDPGTELDRLAARSPLTSVERLRAPLLVLHGAEDPRVPRSQSDRLVARLRALGRDVEYHVFEGEGHGFSARAAQLRAHQLVADFLCRRLGV